MIGIAADLPAEFCAAAKFTEAADVTPDVTSAEAVTAKNWRREDVE